jgi:integrase
MADTAGRRGSVRRDPGRRTWTVVVDAADIGAATRKQVRRRGYRTEREAQQALTEILRELDRGSYVAPDLSTTLQDYAEQTWLPALQVRHRRPSTLESYRRNLRVHVFPRLGRRPLAKVGVGDLDRLYADLLAGAGCRRPLSPRTVRYVHTILHGLFAHAVLKGYLATNPCKRADAPGPRACRSRHMTTWTPEQLRRFLESLPVDRFRAPLFLLATTGMRRGEVLGLRWSDLRLDDFELDVRRTLGSVDNDLVVSDPKTDSGRRTVSLDATTAALLRQHRVEQLRERLATPGATSDHDWVFAHADGTPMHPTRFGRVFVRRVEAAGVPVIRLHDLRHTWASLALRAGVNPKIVQERMGHASVAITLDLYTHTDRAQHAEAAQAVARLFLG